MRTILPFPLLRASGDDAPDTGSRDPLVFPNQTATLDLAASKVPEGESVNHAIDQLPRARALHDEIIGLIRAVRGRFG